MSKITLPAKDLARVIGCVEPASVGRGNGLVALGAACGVVRVEASNGQLTLMRETKCDGVMEMVGLGLSSLLQLLGKLGRDTVTLKVGGGRLQVACGGGLYSFPTEPPREADKVQEWPSSLQIPGPTLSKCIDDCLVVVERGLVNESWNGTHLVTKDGNLRAEATNGKLVIQSTGGGVSGSPIDLIIPRKAAMEIAKLAYDSLGIELLWNENRIRAKGPWGMVEAGLVDGVFPDFDRNWPASTSWFHFQKASLKDAVERISLFTTSEMSTSVWKLGPVTCISCETSKMGSSIEEVAMEKVEGPSVEIQVDPAHILDAIRACDSGVVKIGVTDDRLPVEVSGGLVKCAVSLLRG